MTDPIRLAVVDVDGCLTCGEGQPWDFEVFRFIAELNRRARVDARQFAVTLCTGRPQPYVEAFMQAIDGFMPAIYENGGGLYFPSPYRFVEHSAITPKVRADLIAMRRALREKIVEARIGQFQPGKEVTITLYPAREDITFEQLAQAARRALDGMTNGFSIYASVSSVEILPEGIHKGGGVEWLSRETGIPLAHMAGVGDAPSDLQFLTHVGYCAAPANATADVKREVQYVSPFENGRGVLDILSRWMKGGEPSDAN